MSQHDHNLLTPHAGILPIRCARRPAAAHRLVVLFVACIVAVRVVVYSLHNGVLMRCNSSAIEMAACRHLAFDLVEDELQLPRNALLGHLQNVKALNGAQ